MIDELFSDETRNEALSCLSGIMAAFVSEIGSRPTLGELLEIIGKSVPANSPHVEAVPQPVRFKAKLAGNRRYEGQPSRVAALNDAGFVDASNLLDSVAGRVYAAYGRRASAEDLAAGLLELLKSASGNFEDVRENELLSLAVETPKRATKAKVGDIVAIPLQDSGYRIALVVARNRFGTALGLFEGVSSTPRLSEKLGQATRRRPIYTDDQLMANGSWRVIGHDEQMLSRFPTQPEIYHVPDPIFPNPQIGEFGAAETPDGVLRQIGREEAGQAGLLDNAYRQVYPSSYLHQLLSDGAL